MESSARAPNRESIITISAVLFVLFSLDSISYHPTLIIYPQQHCTPAYLNVARPF